MMAEDAILWLDSNNLLPAGYLSAQDRQLLRDGASTPDSIWGFDPLSSEWYKWRYWWEGALQLEGLIGRAVVTFDIFSGYSCTDEPCFTLKDDWDNDNAHLMNHEFADLSVWNPVKYWADKAKQDLRNSNRDRAMVHAGYAMHFAQDYLNPPHLGPLLWGSYQEVEWPLGLELAWENTDFNYVAKAWSVDYFRLSNQCVSSLNAFPISIENHLLSYRYINALAWPTLPSLAWIIGQGQPGVVLDQRIVNPVMWSEQVSQEILQYVFDLDKRCWASIPGAILDPPALAWIPAPTNKMLMVVRGGGDSVWAGTFDSNGTFNNDWTQIPGAIYDPPALAWNDVAGKMQMVVRGGGNSIWAGTFNSSGLFEGNWQQIPGAIYDPPALTWIPDPVNKMLMVVRGTGDTIWAATFNSSGVFENNWTQIPGAILSAPALACNPDTGVAWMVVQGGGNTIWKASINISGTTISFDNNWQQIPGAILSAPALAWHLSADKMQMVVRGGGDSIWAATFNSNGTFNSDWTHIPGGTPSSVGMVYLPSINSMCIVVRGLDNSIWRMLY
jgi:hypothetical protein